MGIDLYMAASVDGRTARPDGSEAFLDEANWDRFVELAEERGVFLVGRRTYEAVASWDEKGYEDVDATCLVLSSNEDAITSDEFTVVTDPTSVAEQYDGVLVTGGATTNAAFFEAELVDRLYLNVEPVLIGDGVGVVDGSHSVTLSFIRMERSDSRLHLEYRVSY